MTVGISVTLNMENYMQYAEELFKSLSKNSFNVRVVTVGLSRKTNYMRLNLCGREVVALQKCDDGQVSIALKPGGSIAWDLNTERVVIHFKANGDIVIERLMSLDASKVITCTRNPI